MNPVYCRVCFFGQEFECSFKYATDEIPDLRIAIELLEGELIRKAYSKYKNLYKVAEVLGISQPTAFRKIRNMLIHEAILLLNNVE